MPLEGFPERPYVRQEFAPYVLPVAVTSTPLNTNQAETSSYIDSFVVSVPVAAANAVYIGGPGVTIANGLELVPGSLTQWVLDQGGRQLYELQRALSAILQVANCKPQIPDMIPFVFWDTSTIYFIAPAATNIRVCPFRNPFV